MIKFLDVNDPGKTVALGERGEIAIKGPTRTNIVDNRRRPI